MVEAVEPRVVHEWGDLVLGRLRFWVHGRDVAGGGRSA